MITRKNEAPVPGATVRHILEFRPADKDLSIHQRVSRLDSATWRITSDADSTGDYHSGLIRSVPVYQSNLLAREPRVESEMVWNERAIYMCIAQELGVVAKVLGIEECIEDLKSRNIDLSLRTGSAKDYLESATNSAIAELIMAIALGVNIIIDDPNGRVRGLMNNGNVVGFIGEEREGLPAATIISSYNTPCTKPGTGLLKLLPELANYTSITGNFAKGVQGLLGPYHGWLGGIFSPGEVRVGDSLFVNQAPTTPELPPKE
jgi:hypothetical protein